MTRTVAALVLTSVGLVNGETAPTHGVYTHEWGGYASEGGELHMDVLRNHATVYAQGIVTGPLAGEEGAAAKVREALSGYIEHLKDIEPKPGKDQIEAVRSFVKAVGPPVLNKPEYRNDGPLHEVLIRADEILGLEDDPDQDAHPYRKGRIIVHTMIKFYRESLNAYELAIAKDEFDRGGLAPYKLVATEALGGPDPPEHDLDRHSGAPLRNEYYMDAWFVQLAGSAELDMVAPHNSLRMGGLPDA
eukprot:CAMPEP_0174716624 /NCGR_PEP_ID=MMETSP1094-20130205/24358_1 /TAXON_ID=156173 /ORGANISM="Chrysochromulina brevifilum, Strain UTEX LB 985" /LENGTH=245 /DNA_ID=CAMNT_0015916405 /DNA_START=46 /DNA_END=785 /DNA_ORIENTATION=-